MELETLNTKENPLLDRIEVEFLVRHPGEPTPPRDKVRELVAKSTGKPKGTVIIDSIKSHFGEGVSKGFAKCYASEEAIKATEPAHQLKRNGLAAAEGGDA